MPSSRAPSTANCSHAKPVSEAIYSLIVEDRPQTPTEAMGVDEALLDELIEGAPGTVLRLYTWDRPTLSLGRNLDLPAEVVERCSESGVDVVRRPTGGGAVLHDGDVTYSVVAPTHHGGVLSTYGWVAQGMIEGLRGLGLTAEIVLHEGPAKALNCFAMSTGADIAIGGRKICGSAQVRRGGYFLQHGSIPLSDVRARAGELLGVVADDSTFLQAHLPEITQSQAMSALTDGFRRAWRLDDTAGLPNPLLVV